VTVVVVEHDFAFVSAIADTVTVLQDGKLLATGTPAEIAADAAVRAAYLGESGLGSELESGLGSGSDGEFDSGGDSDSDAVEEAV
jgi:branched-chain amino acid transport system ATP-binding protein